MACVMPLVVSPKGSSASRSRGVLKRARHRRLIELKHDRHHAHRASPSRMHRPARWQRRDGLAELQADLLEGLAACNLRSGLDVVRRHPAGQRDVSGPAVPAAAPTLDEQRTGPAARVWKEHERDRGHSGELRALWWEAPRELCGDGRQGAQVAPSVARCTAQTAAGTTGLQSGPMSGLVRRGPVRGGGSCGGSSRTSSRLNWTRWFAGSMSSTAWVSMTGWS